MQKKEATSMRLSTEAKKLLVMLAREHGLSRQAVVEMLVRKEARKHTRVR